MSSQTVHRHILSLMLPAAALSGMAGNADATLWKFNQFSGPGGFEERVELLGFTPERHGFDEATPGDPAGIIEDDDTVDGITFTDINLTGTANAGFADAQMMVSNVDANKARSADNTIGTNVSTSPLATQFTNADSFTLTFPETYAIGLWFIAKTNSALLADDLALTVNDGGQFQGESQGSAELWEETMTDSSFGGWFIGFATDETPFTSVAISSYEEGTEVFFYFSIDDVYTAAAPITTTGALLALGLGVFGIGRRAWTS